MLDVPDVNTVCCGPHEPFLSYVTVVLHCSVMKSKLVNIPSGSCLTGLFCTCSSDFQQIWKVTNYIYSSTFHAILSFLYFLFLLIYILEANIVLLTPLL